MVSFSKIPGTVAFCVVVLASTLASAAPVPQGHDGEDHGDLAGITDPLLAGILDPITYTVGSALGSAASGTYDAVDHLGDTVTTLSDTAGDIVAYLESGLGAAVGDLAPTISDVVHAISHDHGADGDNSGGK